MFWSFLDKLKQAGGFAGKAQNTPTPAPTPQGGFIGPMVNAGLGAMNNVSPTGMNKAPAFGFMNPKADVSNVGPQRPRPNRNRLRAF